MTSGRRPSSRVAEAMLVAPARRSRLMAALRRLAIARGRLPRRTWDPNSPAIAEAPAPQESPKPGAADLGFDRRPLGVQLRLGAGTTVGQLGTVVEYDLFDRVNVGLGIGVGVHRDGFGLIPGAHMRLRPLVFRNSSGAAVHALFTELGISHGRYSTSFEDGIGNLLSG
jgi:hypothetical protein